MSNQLKPALADGFRLEAWNEADATIKNNTVAGSAENMAVPTGATVVRLVANADFWYNLTTTAAVPTDDSTAHSFLPSGAERWIDLTNGLSTNISLIGTGIVCGHFWE